MEDRTHHLFTDMMNKIPAKALLRAIKLEQGMLENDLVHNRIRKSKDVLSILSFCSFIEAAVSGWDYPEIKFPLKDIVLYRNIIRRLVDIGELPATVKSKFDFSYCLSFLENANNP